MRAELKLLSLALVFAVLGALATVMMWHIYHLTLVDLTKPRYAVLGCVVSGLCGPLVVGAFVWLSSRTDRNLRWPAGVGLGLVLATELAFYLPLGFFAVAIHHTAF